MVDSKENYKFDLGVKRLMSHLNFSILYLSWIEFQMES